MNGISLTHESIGQRRPTTKWSHPRLETTIELYHVYAEKPAAICRTLKDAVVLKCDAFNEVICDIQPHRAGVKPIVPTLVNCREIYCVEVDPKRVELAQKKFPEAEFICGDLREVEFDSGKFDAVFDLSTIDHMTFEEAAKVVGKYHSWLKPGGTLLIVAWLTFGASTTRENDMTYESQYYFNAEDFTKLLWSMFDVTERDALFGSRSGPLLVSYTCRKVK